MHDVRQETGAATWNGRALRVSARLVGRWAWQTASIAVALDDQVVLETGGVLKFVGNVAGPFEIDGGRHVATVQWGRGALRSFPVRVAIDDVDVQSGRVTIDNWWVGLWPWIPFAALVLWISVRG